MKPDFLIAGAPRSGTTALSRYLAQHPGIAITEPKEPHFLAFGESGFNFTGPGDDETINRLGVADEGEYQNLLVGARARAALVGDGSVSSIYHATTVANVLTRFGPGPTKCVVLLRNPVDRAYSSYLYQRKRGFEPLARFDEALDAEAERIQEGYHHMWHYVEASRYSKYLPKMTEQFGPENVKVFLFEEFEKSPLRIAAEVTSFIGAEPYSYITEEAVNRSAEPRFYMAAAALRQLRKQSAVKTLLKNIIPTVVRKNVNGFLNSSYPELDPELRSSLAWLLHEELAYIESSRSELNASEHWGHE